MSLNPFECLKKVNTNIKNKERLKILENQNQGNKTYIPETLRKKLKSKRKVINLLFKEQSNDKSIIYYLFLTKIIIELAIKAEKETQKKGYIINNDIQLLKKSLEIILKKKDLEIPVIKLENLELQRKFDYIKKKINQIVTQIQKMIKEPTLKEIIFIFIFIHILTRSIFFADIVKKRFSIASEAISNNIKISLKPVPQKTKLTNYKNRRLILNKATEKKIDFLKLRNQINKIFQKKKIATSVIIMVTKSFSEKNIILIIIK
jgi:hypothetical protein